MYLRFMYVLNYSYMYIIYTLIYIIYIKKLWNINLYISIYYTYKYWCNIKYVLKNEKACKCYQKQKFQTCKVR